MGSWGRTAKEALLEVTRSACHWVIRCLEDQEEPGPARVGPGRRQLLFWQTSSFWEDSGDPFKTTRPFRARQVGPCVSCGQGPAPAASCSPPPARPLFPARHLQGSRRLRWIPPTPVCRVLGNGSQSSAIRYSKRVPKLPRQTVTGSYAFVTFHWG